MLSLKTKRIATITVLLSLLSLPLIAKDLGVQGHLFEISETSLLKVILERLEKLKQTGKLENLQNDIARKVTNNILNPPAIPHIKNTSNPRLFYYDPTLTVADDIKDHQGRLIARRGQKVNPLNYVAWGSAVIFINGKDANQVIWAKRQDPHALIVLTAGSPFTLSDHFKKHVYFDQGGRITKRFGVTQVPCRITQEGMRLEIDEVNPKQKEGLTQASAKERT